MKKTFLLSLIVVGACAHRETKLNELSKAPNINGVPTIEAKQVAAEEQAAFVGEVRFNKNQYKLSAPSKKAIKDLVEKAKKSGQLSEIQIAVWADQEYPSVHTKILSSEQVDLAEKRGLGIRDWIQKRENGVDLKIHNMAERPGMWSEFVANADARVKKAFEVAGIPNSDTSVKLPSKASHAVILLSVKGDNDRKN